MNAVNRPVVIGLADRQPWVLRCAVAEACATQSPLWIMHSTGLPPQMSDSYVEPLVLDDLQAAGQEILDDARRIVEEQAPGLDVEYVLTSVPPLQALESAADEARVMFLGADDVPWFDRLLRTAVAGQLARHAPCPVVVVPEQARSHQAEGDIVLTLDGDTPAEGPIHFAFEEASAHDRVLHVLHATPPGTPPSDLQEIRANIAEVFAVWRERYPDVTVLDAFTVGEPAAVVLRATERAALVVVGRPHGRLKSFAVSRPLASEVLRGSHSPVAVVPVSYPGG